MKKVLFLVFALLLALSIGAQAVDLVYAAHATSNSAVATDWASYFSMTVGANSGGKLLVTNPALPTNLYNGFYVSSNVPVVGARSATYSINLPTTGLWNVYTTFGATTSAKTDAKHVVTDASGSTDWLVNQTVAGANVNTWVSLGTHFFNAYDAANTKIVLTNDNQSTSGSLYVGAVRFEQVVPVPEPGTVAAALTLLAPAGFMFRRRRA